MEVERNTSGFLSDNERLMNRIGIKMAVLLNGQETVIFSTSYIDQIHVYFVIQYENGVYIHIRYISCRSLRSYLRINTYKQEERMYPYRNNKVVTRL